MSEIFADSVYAFEVQYSIHSLDNGLVVYKAPTESNCHEGKFLAHGPSFDIVSKSLEESTYINHITGVPFVRTSILYAQIFEKAIISIDINGVNMDVKSIDMKKINYNLIKLIVKTWMKNVL